MTLDSEYRTLAQKVRQNARAQLLELRAARAARVPDADATPQRRRRKAGRVARHQQDARLAISLAAGDIEIWDAPYFADPVFAQPSRVPLDCPVLIDVCPAEDWDRALLPSPIVQPGSIEIWDMPEMFGPPLPEACETDDLEHGFETDADCPAMVEMFGPFLADHDPSSTDMAVSPDPAITCDAAEPALTLPDGMRVAEEASEGPVSRPALADWEQLELALQAHRAKAETPAQVRSAAPDGDLASLPGAGPGLVWMLRKCGISSLTDLAEADAATLVPKLGMVGQIVNVQGWLRYAQRQVGHLS